MFNIAEARERLLVEMGTLRNVKSLTESCSRDAEIVKKGGGQSQSLGKVVGKVLVHESPITGVKNMGAAAASMSSTPMNFSWSHLVPERAQALRAQQVQASDLTAARTHYYSYANPEEYGSSTIYDSSGMYQQYPSDSSYLQQQQYGQPVSPYDDEQEYYDHRLAKIPESAGEDGVVAFHHQSQALNSAVETLGGLAELFGVEIKTELSRPHTREGSPPTADVAMAKETETGNVTAASLSARPRRPIVFDDEDDRSLGSQGSLGSKASQMSRNRLTAMVHAHVADKPVSVGQASSSSSSPPKDVVGVASGWYVKKFYFTFHTNSRSP